jgi:chromosome segregation protein
VLKGVTFFGFKSFADRVDMEFNGGITAIVGPNGCGKSNLFDGIRWVLGEQSAKSLRGDKMDGVIFSGSDVRKARDHAEVTLILDNRDRHYKNSDHDEIIVTRKLHRNGKSEYFVNKELARLKDIHDLFMDTGIGSNSYSIIGQGQIEKILSTKLEERRAIFEEASEIVKLRSDKEKTEKRLNDVDLDLIRLEDIMREINKQLTPLQNQSKKAIEYNHLSEELQQIEIQTLLHLYDENMEIYTSSQIALEELFSQIKTIESLITNLENDHHESKQGQQKQTDEMMQMQDALNDKRNELERINGYRNLAQEKIQNTKKQLEELSDQFDEFSEKKNISFEEYSKKQNRTREIEGLLLSMQADIASQEDLASEKQNNKFRISQDIEYCRSNLTDKYNDYTKKQMELVQQTEKEMELDEQFSLLQQKKTEVFDTKLACEQKYQQAILVQKELQNKHDESIQHFKQTQQQLTESKKTNETMQESYQEIKVESIRYKDRLDQLDNTLSHYEHYFDGVRSILKDAKKQTDIRVLGTIGDLLECKEGFELALDQLLQTSVQFIVSKDEETAMHYIEFLKKNKAGKATFLPLSMCKSSSFSEEERKQIEGFPGIYAALTIVSCSPEIDPAAKQLLGRSLIADSMDIALKFSKRFNVKAKIATKEGEIIQSSTITGGASKHQKPNTFAMKNQLQDYQRQVEDLNGKMIAMDEIMQKNRLIIAESEAAHEKFQLASEADKEQLDQHTNQFTVLQLQANGHRDRYEEMEVQEKEIRKQLSQTRQNIMNLKITCDQRKIEHDQLAKQLHELTGEQEDSLTSNELLKQDVNELKLQVGRLEEERKQLLDVIQTFTSDSETYAAKIALLLDRKKMDEEQAEAAEQHFATLTSQIEVLQGTIETHTVEVNEKKAEVQSLYAKVEAIENELKRNQQKRKELDDKASALQIHLAKKETEKQNILSRVLEGYQMEEDALLALDRLPIDLQENKKKVEKLKKAIYQLGSINHAAIEDCKLLEERFNTENTQVLDVKSAKENLLEMIQEVEKEMTSRFVSTFNAIADKFQQIFVELFGGGRASLTLVDPKDPLNSAIEIIAQPPGKKPQTINILSGGEKAFTAVAIIFAIISSKPSPFVILDEVDAALDEANVARFADLLVKFAEHSQFIIVTHRKATMLAATIDLGSDSSKSSKIYGITQQELGVSIVFPHTIEEFVEKISS